MKNGKIIAKMTREFIQETIKNESEDIPEDAEMVGMEYKAERDQFEVVLTSEDLPETPEGALVIYAE